MWYIADPPSSRQREMKMVQDRLKRAIAIRGYKQRDLAEKLGMTDATLSRYVRGNREPRGDIICKIAETLNVSAEWLLGLSDKMDRHTDDPISEMKEGCFYIVKDGILYEAKRFNRRGNEDVP